MLKIKGLSRANTFLLYALFGVLLITLNIAILPALAAPVPQNLRIIMSTAGNDSLTVSWSQSGSVTGYWISRDGQINKWSTAVTGNVNYVDSGLTPGKAYVYKVASSDAIEVSPWSLKASGTTKTGVSYTKPHAPFTDNTNMCQACHSVHMSPTPYKTLYKKYSNQPGDYAVSGAGQSLPGADICFNCHDGTGAGYNVKQYYDQPTSAQVKWPGHMTRRTGTTASEVSFGGWRYIQGLPAGSRLPCMVCHDSHVSSKGNWKMLADGLVDYAKSPSGAWSNDTVAPYNILSDATNTGVIDTANNAWEKCTVCHHDGSRTNGIMRVAGLDLYWPSSTNGTLGGELDVKDHDGSKGSCACHAGSVNSQNNVHALAEGGRPSGPVDDCSLCHQDVTDRTMSSSIVSRHYIEAPTGNYDPTYPADRCTTKCHVNHGPARTPTDSFNLYTNAVSRQGAANYDFTASASQPGLCLSCHQTTQTSNRPGGTSASTSYVSAVPPQPFIDSSHSYPSTSYKTKDGKRSHVMTCLKCHRDNDQATEFSRWGPHASANRSLLYLPATQLGGNPGDEEQTCFACHSPSRDQWAGRTMATAAWRISQAFNQSPLNQGHRMFLMSQTVDRHRASEGKFFKWMPSTARHVECGDCHNSHAATQSYNYNAALPYTGSANQLESPSGQSISGSLRAVWGVSISYSGIITSSPNYINAAGPTAGNYIFTASATKQWMICLKCHSSYAYGTSAAERPLIPSGKNLAGTIATQTDQALEFNPANLAYHPIISAGKNQPPTTANVRWIPTTNATVNNEQLHPNYSPQGLDHTFVPPFGAKSLITCSDCHGHQSSSYSRGYYTSAPSVVNSYDYPRGPHGSSKKWILRGLDRTINYRKANNATFSYAFPMNAGTAETATQQAGNNNNFCLNCHRADVYGYFVGGASDTSFVANRMSRIRHGLFDNGRGDPWENIGPQAAAQNPIICNYCHAGGSRGGLHGTNKALNINTSTGGTGMGRRMLNGAQWRGYNYPAAGTTPICTYTNVSDANHNDSQAVNNCSNNETDRSGVAGSINYTYF